VLARSFGSARSMLVPYCLGALASAAAIGKVGSAFNYMLELCAALSLATGVVLAWSRQHCEWRTARAAVLGALIVQTASFAWVSVGSDLPVLRRQWSALPDLDRLRALVANAPGPILIDEQLGEIPLTGHRLQLQPFELTQLAQHGRWNEAPLVDAIRHRRFAFVALKRSSATRNTGMWTPAMLRAIEETYELRVVIAGNLIFGPRT
jgi:hypothetical protein